MKRFAQKEICYCTIQEIKAVARPAEITFFSQTCNFRGKCRGKTDLPEFSAWFLGKARSTLLAEAEPLVPRA